jgi:hypothetical protein
MTLQERSELVLGVARVLHVSIILAMSFGLIAPKLAIDRLAGGAARSAS